MSAGAQMVALAATTAVLPASSVGSHAAPVMAGALLQRITAPLAGDKQAERIQLPSGSVQCPNSGPGASCTQAAVVPQAGSSALPEGSAPCPADPVKAAPAAPGACSEASDPSAAGEPSITLRADRRILAAGSPALLVATSGVSVTRTAWAIEIFDVTSGGLVGACAHSTVCTVAYTGTAGRRSFVAYVMPPGQKVPDDAVASSNAVDARWLGVSLAAGAPSIVAPGKPVTFTATAGEDVGKIGYRIELRDAASGRLLTFCSHGNACSTALVEPAGANRTVVANLVPQSPGAHAGNASLGLASGTASGTWLGVELESSTTAGLSGGSVSLKATANADLSRTPWSIYIQSESGQLVGQPCKARTCAARITVGANDTSRYRALIGRSVSQSNLELQVASQLVRPIRVLWGVDSCKAFTSDPAGGSGLLPQVTSILGAPSFWGRYLPDTPNCPGLSGAEISAAHAHHMGILPIYNDYDCSAVSSSATGAAYGLAAVEWAWNDGVPQGTAIAIDIEPAGDACPGASGVDKAFIEGWYDELVRARYVPVFYGNTTPGSAFTGAWCAAVAEQSDMAAGSYLWSFEPSLLTGHTRAGAPTFGPYYSGCPGQYTVWQYSLSSGSNPDVDVDQARNDFPFWYP